MLGAPRMDRNKLREFGSRFMALLAQYEIQSEVVDIRIVVPHDYFDSIKDRFPADSSGEHVLGESGSGWVISLLSSK